jgi:hypothetical protein
MIPNFKNLVNMKKVLLLMTAALTLAACTKEKPLSNTESVKINFTPYDVAPMKATSSVSTVCSRLDIYIIEQGTTDTLRIHQARDINTDFGSATVTLKTNKTYNLVAVAHNSTDTCTFNGGIVSFSGDIIKQTLVADTTFSPGDGLSLNVVMQRIVGMFKMRVTDAIPTDITGFQFTISPSGRKFDISTMQSTDPAERTHTINSVSTDNNGVAAYNVYVMADDMTNVKYVDIEAKALNPTNDGEVRQFTQVPIKNGYVTTYSGTFFITFGMDFSFSVDDWTEYGSFTF